MIIHHLTETTFHADPTDCAGGYDHNYNLISTRSLRKALRIARKVISFSDIEVLPDECCNNGCIYYRGGEPVKVYRHERRKYEKALNLKLQELKECGVAVICEGETLTLNTVELEKEYDGFFTRSW